MRAIEPRQFNSLVTLVIGVVAGLVLGLFVGWVVWPVEWQGATLNELFPEEKAEYLAAVADAYALNRTPEALEVARQRVATLGADLSTAMTAAIDHFSDLNDPNRELRISNLTFLASALDVPTPDLVGLTQPQQAESAPVSDGAGAVPAVVGGEEAPPSWLTWLLYILAGLLLILVGLYLILRLRQSGQSKGQMDEHIDRQIGSLQNVMADPWAQRTQSYVAPEDDPAYGMAATTDDEWQKPATAHQELPADEYSFDDDQEEPSHVRPGTGTWVGANRGSHVAQLRLDEAAEELEEEDDLGEEEEPTYSSPPYQPTQSNAPASRQPTEPATPAVTPSAYERMTALTSRPLSSAPASTAERPVSLLRAASKHKLLEVYTAQYQAGIRDYNELHGIVDPVGKKYLGECGMGASTKNSLLQNNPDQVVALEVWLFDKTDEKNVGTQTRVLLSEYAIDHNLEPAFLKGRVDDPRPFTAQPNTRFQIESQNLLLDCTITEVIYTSSGPAKGIFQSVKVEMAVHQKS